MILNILKPNEQFQAEIKAWQKKHKACSIALQMIPNVKITVFDKYYHRKYILLSILVLFLCKYFCFVHSHLDFITIWDFFAGFEFVRSLLICNSMETLDITVSSEVKRSILYYL